MAAREVLAVLRARQAAGTAVGAAAVLVSAVLSVPSVAGHGRPARPPAARAVLAAAPQPEVASPPAVVTEPEQPLGQLAPAPPPGPAPAPAQARVPAPAPGPAAVAEPGPEERGRAVLAGLNYPWQELGFSVRFVPWDGGPLLGLTDAGSRSITVLVRPRQSELSLRATVGHELGHALDAVTGSDEQHARYLRMRGVPEGTPWYPCAGCDDADSPAGDWAEVFAVAVTGRGDFRSRLAAEPDDTALRDLAPLFAPPSARPRPAASPAPPSPTPTPSPSPSRGLLPPLPR